MAEEREGEETKPQEEAGSADSEQVTTETDGEEGKKTKFIVGHIGLIFTIST